MDSPPWLSASREEHRVPWGCRRGDGRIKACAARVIAHVGAIPAGLSPQVRNNAARIVRAYLRTH